MVKTLELVSLYGEMSDLLTFYVLEFLKKFELDDRVSSLWRPHKYKFWRLEKEWKVQFLPPVSRRKWPTI